MGAWIWVLVPLVAIIGSYIVDYQKNKMKMMNLGQKNEQNVDDLHKLVNSLKTRIENLEAIAAGEPDDFKRGSGAGMSEIEIDEDSLKKENREQVSQIANRHRE